MSNLPRTGVAVPNSTATDQVPSDLLSVLSALEPFWQGKFANASARDAAIPSPSGGDWCWLTSPGKFVYYDPTLGAWADLMNPGAWGTWTPTLQSPGGTAFTLGTGSQQIGRFSLLGKRVDFQCTWNFGSSVIGPGGQLVFKLPPGLAAANVSGLQQMGPCSLWVPSLSRNFQGFWSCKAGETTAAPHFPVDTTHSYMDLFQDTTDGSSASTGVPLISGGYPIQVNGTLTASGTYQIA